ncbi:MAG: aegerolysin family protein [Tissierellia bacterium]|nr:aegerolysin family protein [Tissierellia bacterium]
MKGVYFDNYKQRWIAKIQKNNKVIRKGFINENDAINYRKELERMNNINMINIDNLKPDNFVKQEEHKTIEYKGHMQDFTETNIVTREVNSGKFYVPTSRGKVIHQDNATIVILHDGSKGIAKCGKNDTFSRKTGLKIAYNRAMIEHLSKEIKELTK